MSGCATPTVSFTKDGASFEGFMKDRFECAQAGRVTVSSSFINQYGGAGSSNVFVDRGQFLSCMGARGYTVDFSGTSGFKAPSGSEIIVIN